MQIAQSLTVELSTYETHQPFPSVPIEIAITPSGHLGRKPCSIIIAFRNLEHAKKSNATLDKSSFRAYVRI